MRDAGVDFDLCNCADQFGDERNFMRCSQGMQLEDFVPFDEILAPVLVTVVAVRGCSRLLQGSPEMRIQVW